MIKKLLTALYSDDNILYFNKDSGSVIFSTNKIGIFSIDLNNINLDDTDYNEDGPETIFLSPQVKQSAIISNKHGIYESPHELLKDLRIRISGN